MKVVNEENKSEPKVEEVKTIAIPVQELEMFSKIIGLILVGDNREIALQTHYAQMVNGAVKKNEETK